MLKVTGGLNLKDFSGMKVGLGEAGNLYEVESYDDFEDLLLTVSKEELENMQVIGDGSNTVFVSDKKINLLKINIKEIVPLSLGEGLGERIMKVGAGVNWDYFVQEYIKLGGVGMEYLSAIPGSVGAAPIQNIGAYGKEVSEFIHGVYTYDKTNREFRLILKEDGEFGYRNSIFKKQKNRFIILSVNFEIIVGDQENVKIPEYKDIQNVLFNKDKIKVPSDMWTLKLPENIDELKKKKYTVQEIRDAVLIVRANKLPDPSIIPNCGSFFANPIIPRSELPKLQEKFPEVPVFAVVGMGDRANVEDEQVKIPIAYIIEKIGLKGYNSDFANGNFGVHKNHALIVISNGKGSVSEFLEFIEFLKQKVFTESGLRIEEEVNLI